MAVESKRMGGLEGFQRKFLRGLAHKLKPVAFVGQKGVTEAVIRAVDEALGTHELIKMKFVERRDKDAKREIAEEVSARTDSEMVGMIGHTVILYRPGADPDRRRIIVPGGGRKER